MDKYIMPKLEELNYISSNGTELRGIQINLNDVTKDYPLLNGTTYTGGTLGHLDISKMRKILESDAERPQEEFIIPLYTFPTGDSFTESLTYSGCCKKYRGMVNDDYKILEWDIPYTGVS